MESWLINDIAALMICVVCAGILIPQILLISFRKKLFDMPDARKIHSLPVPRLGGMAFMPVVFFACVLLLGLNMMFTNTTNILDPVIAQAQTLSFLACAVLLLYVVGMADDLIGIKYRAKFAVQFICGVFMICGGVWISSFQGILGFGDISPWFGWPFAVIVMIFIINAINLIDGIDGLASGLCSIAFLVYGVAYYLEGSYIYSLLSFCSLGVLIPFFYYNVFGDAAKRKKIFMGDTGSLTIGMMISFLAIHLEQLSPVPALENANMCAIAFVPLLIPCFDVLRVYGERLLNHTNPFLPDKRHIHHKLMDLGFSQRKALTTLVLTSLVFSVINIWLSIYININFLLFGDMIVWTLVMVGLNKAIFKSSKKKAN